jgi:hypothetical protein
MQITLTGFVFVVINFLTLLWYTPTLDQDCPRWVYASWAIGLFLYQTFDAVDGTQAWVPQRYVWSGGLTWTQAENAAERAAGRAVRSRCVVRCGLAGDLTG